MTILVVQRLHEEIYFAKIVQQTGRVGLRRLVGDDLRDVDQIAVARVAFSLSFFKRRRRGEISLEHSSLLS